MKVRYARVKIKESSQAFCPLHGFIQVSRKETLVNLFLGLKEEAFPQSHLILAKTFLYCSGRAAAQHRALSRLLRLLSPTPEAF